MSAPPAHPAAPGKGGLEWRATVARLTPVLVLVAGAAAGFVALASQPRVVFQSDSPYGKVFVVDKGDVRSLRFDRPDGNYQSTMLRSDPSRVLLQYVRVASAGLAFTPGRERALVMGLGGGSFPMLLYRRFPKMVIDAVEINPVVVDVAKRYFGVREDERMRLIVDDGARYMEQEGSRYDVILLDAYSDVGIPEHLQSADFFEDVRARLAPKGAAIINLALMDADTEARIIRTYAGVFESCVLLRCRTLGNVILVGMEEEPPAERALRSRWKRLGQELGIRDLSGDVESVEDCVP